MFYWGLRWKIAVFWALRVVFLNTSFKRYGVQVGLDLIHPMIFKKKLFGIVIQFAFINM